MCVCAYIHMYIYIYGILVEVSRALAIAFMSFRRISNTLFGATHGMFVACKRPESPLNKPKAPELDGRVRIVHFYSWYACFCLTASYKLADGKSFIGALPTNIVTSRRRYLIPRPRHLLIVTCAGDAA